MSIPTPGIPYDLAQLYQLIPYLNVPGTLVDAIACGCTTCCVAACGCADWCLLSLVDAIVRRCTTCCFAVCDVLTDTGTA